MMKILSCQSRVTVVMFCLQSNNPGLIIDSSDGNRLDFHDRSSV